MSFHLSWFIVLGALRYICSLPYQFVSHLFYSVYAQRKKKKKKEKKEKNINKCTRVYIQYQYSLSMYMDL